MKNIYLKVDARNRISLTKLTKNVPALYRAYVQDGKIILDPVREMSEEETWLFKPENKELLAHLKESLKQEATIDLGSFKKYLK